MAKYDITYSCGHFDRINLIGPHKQRESRIEWLETHGLCESCYRAQLERNRAAATEAAKAKAEADGLPPLQGTEKQMAWAERIRAQAIEKMESREIDTHGEDHPELVGAIMAMLGRVAAIPNAKWWIDHREDNFLPMALVRDVVGRQERDEATITALIDAAYREQEIVASISTPEIAAAEIEAKAEATLRPENPLTETVAEIKTTANAVEVQFPERRDDFRELVRFKLGYAWTGDRWQRVLKSTNGTPIDRAVELGCRLLAAGFCVRTFDPEIRERILVSNYEPECKRWVMAVIKGDHSGKISLWWPRGEDFYGAAKRLPGSRYVKPCIIVPPEQYEQILDFAEVNGFRVTDNARQLLDAARSVREAALTCQVAAKAEAVPRVPGRKPRPLDVPENVQVANEFQD